MPLWGKAAVSLAEAASEAADTAKSSGEQLDQTLKDLQASLDSSVVQQKQAADDAMTP